MQKDHEHLLIVEVDFLEVEEIRLCEFRGRERFVF